MGAQFTSGTLRHNLLFIRHNSVLPGFCAKPVKLDVLQLDS